MKDNKYLNTIATFILILVFVIWIGSYIDRASKQKTVYYKKIVHSKYGINNVYIKKTEIDSMDFIKHIRE